MNRLLAVLVISFVSVSSRDVAWAHGELTEQIAALTQQIQTSPTVDLFLRRAELFRLDGDCLSALRDCTEASTLSVDESRVHLVRARVLLDQNKCAKAKAELDALLQMEPQNTRARILRAQCATKLNDTTAAVADYRVAIETATPEPDWYFELAHVLQAGGKTAEAVEILDGGAERLGGAISLQLLAIDFSVDARDYNGALTRLEKITTQSARKEKWLFRRGEILARAGRTAEARDAFWSAEKAVLALPVNLQRSATSQSLLHEIGLMLRNSN